MRTEEETERRMRFWFVIIGSLLILVQFVLTIAWAPAPWDTVLGVLLGLCIGTSLWFWAR